MGGESPTVGDIRVRLEKIPDGPFTVLALQVESGGDTRDTFIPYRMISRGFCGISKEEQKRRQIAEGRLVGSQLAEKDKCSFGPLDGLCCCCAGICNLVSTLFSGLLTPEVFHVFSGERKVSECWDEVKARSAMTKWF